MAGNLAEIKLNLRTFDFPFCAREALEQAGQSVHEFVINEDDY
jgi:hypothetical protein